MLNIFTNTITLEIVIPSILHGHFSTWRTNYSKCLNQHFLKVI